MSACLQQRLQSKSVPADQRPVEIPSIPAAQIPSASDRLTLGSLTPFGIGGRRLCFVHPDDPAKCVKVLRQDKLKTIRSRHTSRLIPVSWRRLHDNNASEQRALSREYNRHGSLAWEHMPRCYGTVKTDLGGGLVLDLYRDSDGQIARTLRELLRTGHELESFRKAFDQFGDFLLKNRIVTRSLLDHNLVVQRRSDESWKFYLIDGIGDRNFLPIGRWCKSIAELTVRRRLDKAWNRYEESHRRGTPGKQMISPERTWQQGCLLHRT